MTPIRVRRATPDDWPAIWRIISAVVAAGDTYTYAPDTSEAEARRLWMGDGFITCVASLLLHDGKRVSKANTACVDRTKHGDLGATMDRPPPSAAL